MIEYIINWLSDVKDEYDVNPFIFLLIYLISIVPCWIGLYKIVVNVRNKNTQKMINWLIIFGLIFFSPYMYIYLWGNNYPLWFHFVFAIIILLSVFSVTKKIIREVKNKES